MLTHLQAAAIFEEVADLLELNGENSFKIRAYKNAAEILQSLSQPFSIWASTLKSNPVEGIGPGLTEKIQELAQTGALSLHQELRAGLPVGLTELIGIPGLGLKKIRVLYQTLEISSVRALEDACQTNQLAQVPGFGQKTQANLLIALAQKRQYQGWHRYLEAHSTALKLSAYLRQSSEVLEVQMAGALRRSCEIVPNIELVASTKNPNEVFAFFETFPEIEKIIAQDATSFTVQLHGGLACSLHLALPEQFIRTLHRFTGSSEHVKTFEKRLQLTELEVQNYTDEEALYQAVGVSFIPPELRENQGEWEAAQTHTLPDLIEYTDLKGTFHCHTTESDGKNTLQEMVDAARASGLTYLGIADHSRSQFQAHGLTEERLLAQIDQIRKLNQRLEGFHVFAGCEVDILKDGTLDFSDDILRHLDYAVASVHSAFNLEEAAMTRRICRAMENPYIRILGHATGRLLLQREGYAVNLEKIIDCAVETGTWIELNANPRRLDMDWRWWHRARDKGVKCAINPDAHHTSGFEHLKLGVQIARKGWLSPEDVINTCSFSEIEKLLSQNKISRSSNQK